MTPEDDALAGELALGLIEGEDRAAALRRVLADPEFAGAVEAWRERLGPLFAEVAEVEPPESAWRGIERAVATPDAAGAVARLRRWRVATFVSTGLAAALAGVLVVQQPAPAPIAPTPAPAAAQPMLVAQLMPEGAQPTLLAAWDAERGVIRIAPAAMPTRGRTPQLWVIPADGTPRSLGLIDLRGAGDMAIPVDRRAYMAGAATLAVSLEPAGGSPTGLPTGPVIASGRLSPI